MPNKSRPVLFGREAARRIARSVQASEGRPADATAAGYRRSSASAYPMAASVTTAIPTGTIASPSSSGRVTIYRDDDAGGLAAAETGQQVNNYHTLSASIAAGKTVTVYWRASCWWLVAADC
jgi:hypothetical protein